MRAISRVAGVSFNTVNKLLVDAGETCLDLHDQLVTHVKSRYVQCDEIWAFCYAKQKNVPTAKAAPAEAGDIWTWTALDSETKLIITYVVGGRTARAAQVMMDDLASRLVDRVQLSTDGLSLYRTAVDAAFGGDIDFAQVVKIFGEAPGVGPERKYSPPVCVATVPRDNYLER